MSEESKPEGYKLPAEMYSKEQLEQVYVPKGKETGKPFPNLPYDEVFVPTMDRILGGWPARRLAQWLRDKHGQQIHPNAIDKYIRDYLPEDVRNQMRLCAETFKDAVVEPLAVMEDCVRKQKERIQNAYAAVRKDESFVFNFHKELGLLHKMSADLFNKMQSMGKIPKAADKHEVKTSSEAGSTDETKSPEQKLLSSLNHNQAARVLSILERMEKKMVADEVITEAASKTSVEEKSEPK